MKKLNVLTSKKYTVHMHYSCLFKFKEVLGITIFFFTSADIILNIEDKYCHYVRHQIWKKEKKNSQEILYE